MTDTRVININISKGNALMIRVDGKQGYVFMGAPDEGHPFIVSNDTDQREKESGFFLLLDKPEQPEAEGE